MSGQKNLEEQVVATVVKFVSSSHKNGKETTSLSPVLEAISSIPLNRSGQLERLLRSAIHTANADRMRLISRFWPQSDPALSWLDLCNGSGYRREGALRAAFDGVPNSHFFALAIRRLNDWVPEVRAAARERLPQIAVVSKPVDVAAALCAILPNWFAWGRLQDVDREILLEIISIESVRRALKSQLIASTTGSVASVLAQAGRSDSLDEFLPEIAYAAAQPAVRAKAYGALLDHKMVWLEGRTWEWTDKRYCKGHVKAVHGSRHLTLETKFQETFKACLADQSAIVRAVAGSILIRDFEKLHPFGLEMAKLLASDKNASIAARGKFLIDRHDQKSSQLA